MEIHTPEGPILSFKHLLIQLATITAGVLIALSLEGITGWFHHRALVREAKANITSEIADNKKELDGSLQRIPDSTKELRLALQFIDDLLIRKRTDIHSLSLTYSGAQFTTTSKITAETTGALGYMEYADVKSYAGVYELQQEYVRLQDRLLDVWTPLLNATHAGDEIEKTSERELQEWRQQILTTLSHLQVIAGIGKHLSDEYSKVLAREH
jgi:hypothetical protein